MKQQNKIKTLKSTKLKQYFTFNITTRYDNSTLQKQIRWRMHLGQCHKELAFPLQARIKEHWKTKFTYFFKEYGQIQFDTFLAYSFEYLHQIW